MPDDTRDLRLSTTAAAKQNHLIAALDAADYARLAPHLERVLLPLGTVICDSAARIDHVYFPVNAIVSLLYDLENGSSVEIAVAGNEGMVGISLFMGGVTTAGRAVVRSAGYGYRLKAAVLTAEFERGGSLRQLLLRYTQALITQMAQTAVCNRSHQMEQQLCRTLLLSLDRLQGDELKMTHELVANMLGVRRESVTTAAGKLQAAGLIRCDRGRITVLDREQLEEHACECYSVVRAEYDRLLPRRTQVLQSSVVVTRSVARRAGYPGGAQRAHASAAAG